MKTQNMFRLVLTLALLSATTLNAQMFRFNIVSPEVHEDNSITFRFSAPDAISVELSGEFLSEKMPMVKDENGVWSVTTAPVTPDLYPYSFEVDGVGVADPNNVLIFPNEGFKRSLVDVKGNTPSIYAEKNIPHGKITYRFYQSEILNDTRPLVVYTPPGYDKNSGKKYPVLYLIHGATDTYETWFKVGRTHFILDNLIAEGKAEPMIIVMPYANQRMTLTGKRLPNASADFTEELVKEIIPFTENNYSVIPNASGRAIAGFSRGGGQTLTAGLTRPDVFASVCAFAPAMDGERVKENIDNGTFASLDDLKSKLQFFWLSCGTDDFLYNRALSLEKTYKELGIPCQVLYTPGGHTWMNCRQYLYEIAQKLFR